MESYVIGLMCTLINLYNMDFTTDVGKWTFANSIITCILLPVYLLFPVFGVLYMLGNWSMLEHEYIKGRFGEIYEGFNVKSKQMVFYWGIESLRKTLLCLVVIIYPDFIAAQSMILFLTSIALIIAAGYFKARNSSYDRKMDIFQEAKLIVIMYHLMLFTMFVSDLETRQ